VIDTFEYAYDAVGNRAVRLNAGAATGTATWATGLPPGAYGLRVQTGLSAPRMALMSVSYC